MCAHMLSGTAGEVHVGDEDVGSWDTDGTTYSETVFCSSGEDVSVTE